MVNIAYIRIAKADYDNNYQVKALEKFNIHKWFTEEASIKAKSRPVLDEMIYSVSDGDTVYIHDFSRIARSVTELSKIVDELENKNAHFVSVQENFDTNTEQGRIMKDMLSSLASLERNVYKEKQKEGIEKAKAAGKYKGRVRIKVPNFNEYYDMYINKKITKTDIAKELNISRPTVDRLMKEYKESIKNSLV